MLSCFVSIGGLCVMVKLCASWQGVAFSLLFFISVGLSWHSSKNRCGWEVDILTYAYLQTPTPYPHTLTHTDTVDSHQLLHFASSPRYTQTDALHKDKEIFHFTHFSLMLLASLAGGLSRFMTTPPPPQKKKSQFLTQVKVKMCSAPHSRTKEAHNPLCTCCQ